jgi:hypothetical protein
MLNMLSQDGWHPVTMASLALPSVIAVILENKIMEEASASRTDYSTDLSESWHKLATASRFPSEAESQNAKRLCRNA